MNSLEIEKKTLHLKLIQLTVFTSPCTKKYKGRIFTVHSFYSCKLMYLPLWNGFHYSVMQMYPDDAGRTVLKIKTRTKKKKKDYD